MKICINISNVLYSATIRNVSIKTTSCLYRCTCRFVVFNKLHHIKSYYTIYRYL